MQATSVFISVLSLAVSLLTIYLTLLHRGRVKMTQPSIIAFACDHSPPTPPRTKIYLRTLLYSTSKRGLVVESMYVSLRTNDSHQSFSVWAFGDNSLAAGGGLFIPDAGTVGNHHFVVSPNDDQYVFQPGIYKLAVLANMVGNKKPIVLFSQSIELTPQESDALKDSRKSVMFIWSPDSRQYFSNIETMPINTKGIRDLIEVAHHAFGRK